MWIFPASLFFGFFVGWLVGAVGGGGVYLFFLFITPAYWVDGVKNFLHSLEKITTFKK